MKYLLILAFFFQDLPYQRTFQHLKGNERIDSINYYVFHDQAKQIKHYLKLIEEAIEMANQLGYTKGKIQALANHGMLQARLREDTVAINLLTALDGEENQKYLADYQPKIDETLARLYFAIGLIDKANINYARAIDTYRQNNDVDHLILTYIDQASKHSKRGFYNEGLSYFLKAYDTSLKENHDRHLPDIYRYLANIYNRLDSFDKAKEFARKSINYYQNVENDNIKLGDGYLTLAGIYVFEDNDDSATYHYHKALNLYRESRSDLGVAYAASNIAEVFLSNQQLDSSKYYLELAKEGLRKSGVYKQMEAHIDLKVAEVLSIEGNFSKANESARHALAITTEQGDLEFISTSYLTLSKINERFGRPDSALYFLKKYHSYTDSIKNNNTERRFANQRIKIETIEKENEILTLSKTNLENKAIIKNTSFWITVLIIGITLLILLITLLFVIFKQRLTAVKQKATIDAILETQESERQRVAKDLHDSVGSMLASIKIDLQQKTPLVEGKAQFKSSSHSTVQLLDQTSKEIRRIAHNMMPGSLLKFGLVKALEQMVEQISNTEKIEGEIETFGLDDRLDNTTEINLYRIVQELIQNVVKHANAKQFSIQITKHKNSLNLIVEDDGGGFDINLIKAKPGMGWENVSSRVASLNGTLQVDSSSAIGTSVLIEVPIDN